ncbi:hypothetical protein C4D60_Mb01t25700 [Musa balbisiana]|uniref:histidine kinase n=1 Tax=Musa balbisiana TaxID=52838 RepID=A0A4S8JPU6_MUSBA|nr:hypothetical protein C4D60_Mb01t25700 [Musa balbisiana]
MSDLETTSHKRESVKTKQEHHKVLSKILFNIHCLVVGLVMLFIGFAVGKFSKPPDQFQHQKHYKPQNSKYSGKWSKKFLFLGIFLGLLVAMWIFVSMNADITERRKDTLVNMCDERARMLQDQFNVSMNHVHALAILVLTFHHGKQHSVIDQKIFAEYTARTAFERPLMSGVAYALRVLHTERGRFKQQHAWKIKKMETEFQSLVKDDYNSEKLDPSPVQDEYAPVIFSQETVSHIVSIDMMSGKEGHENILRAWATGKGILTSPCNILKSNHLGVVLTFAVYNTNLPLNATPKERIETTVGYLGASFDVPSLVEKLLQQFASKQTIMMYGPDTAASGEMHISYIDFVDPTRKHEMHCRFKHKPPLPWSAITMSVGVAVIVLLVGHIFHAALNHIGEVEDDYCQMRELKVQAESADVAKSQFLATVSHEIRTPMNGVLGMLQILMDTDLDATQQDFAMTAQSSGKALIALINEVLDQAKIESGRLELEAVPFDLRDVLDNVLSLFSDKSQAKGIEMAVYVSEQVPGILIGDPGRFRQIITKLVGNSVKANCSSNFLIIQAIFSTSFPAILPVQEVGHIFVSVDLVEEVESEKDVLCETLSGFKVADKQKVWENFTMFKSSTEGNDAINLMVTVEDTGVGIPQDAQNRIFTPFMQADSSTSRTYGGTGIGLSISKCLVDLMGGEIGFVSKPGTGSTFSFTAVLKEGCRNSGDTKRHHSDPALSDFQGMRVLVADGRCIRDRIIKYHLRRLGIHVDVASNQDSALGAVLDVCNTRQNGAAMPLGSLPNMFLVATSQSPTEVHELKSAGYVDSILKLLHPGIVAACLWKALGMEHKRQQFKGKSMPLQSLLSGKNILVVDDNAINCKVAAAVLEKYGATVTSADSGKEAIKMLQPPHNFDACFMDVQMPEMDGSGDSSLELYGNVVHWHIPILAITADVIQATHEECL